MKINTHRVSPSLLSCGMSNKAPLIGLVCSVFGVILSLAVYVISSTISADEQAAFDEANKEIGLEVEMSSLWVRDEGKKFFFF